MAFCHYGVNDTEASKSALSYLITSSARASTLGGILFVSSNRSTANAPFNRCAPFNPLSDVAAVLPVRKALGLVIG